ncbi:hypothetical protein REMIM1_PE00187 (plasmid) [Rhizobium etli bv. mimosae str. Mim1]|nr:hypothetical protein REMIM1_PE00187 [Rhizobium etli bv. mimosae str. Mim1]
MNLAHGKAMRRAVSFGKEATIYRNLKPFHDASSVPRPMLATSDYFEIGRSGSFR